MLIAAAASSQQSYEEPAKDVSHHPDQGNCAQQGKQAQTYASQLRSGCQHEKGSTTAGWPYQARAGHKREGEPTAIARGTCHPRAISVDHQGVELSADQCSGQAVGNLVDIGR